MPAVLTPRGPAADRLEGDSMHPTIKRVALRLAALSAVVVTFAVAGSTMPAAATADQSGPTVICPNNNNNWDNGPCH
jgi:hypothetical protein